MVKESDKSEAGVRYDISLGALAVVTASVQVVGDGHKNIGDLVGEAVNDGACSWEYQGTTDDAPSINAIRAKDPPGEKNI